MAASYAAVVIFAAILVIERYLQYARHPADVAASSGMYAFGDLLLEMFIAGALLVPTLLLVLVIRKSEAQPPVNRVLGPGSPPVELLLLGSRISF